MRLKLSWSIFIISSLGIVACFVYQLLVIYTPNLKIPSESSSFQLIIKSYSWIITILYGIFGFSLLSLKVVRLERLLTYLICLAVTCLILGWSTFPVSSQDIYWNLFIGKMSVIHHLDPYSVSPGMFSSHPWHTPIRWWNDVTMIYGPLWTLFVQFISFPDLLTASVLLEKFVFLISIIASGGILWKIFDLHQFSLEKKVKLFGLFCLNPVLIGQGLVDGHNDIFLLFFILASYYYLLKKRYYSSIIALILASFIKYTPIILIMVPLWHLFFERPLGKNELARRIFTVAMIVLISCALLLPWITNTQFIQSLGVESRSVQANNAAQYAPGGLILRDITRLDTPTIRLISGIMGLLLAVALTVKKKFLHAYTAPFALMFFFVSWFQPWYFLWILPLGLIAWPPGLFIVASMSMLLITSTLGPVTLLLPFGYALAVYMPKTKML